MPGYIERDALEHHFMTKRRYLTKDTVMDAAYEVNKFPAADVAPVVHGRWFDTGVENETGNIYFCSVCNKFNNPNKKDVQMKRVKEKPNYCHNCGAKMDLEG